MRSSVFFFAPESSEISKKEGKKRHSYPTHSASPNSWREEKGVNENVGSLAGPFGKGEEGAGEGKWHADDGASSGGKLRCRPKRQDSGLEL